MSILPKIQEKINQHILPLVKTKWKARVLLGLQAFSLQPFVSINANARMSRSNADAAERQIYRLLDANLSHVFASLLFEFHRITRESVIALDFSIFHPFAVLCFGLQTRDGRAIPIWQDILKYPVEKDSQNSFILDTLSELLAVVGSSFKLVCDRGFIGEHLIHGFLDKEITFYVRLKAGMHWKVQGKRRQLKHQWQLDQTGSIYGEKLRVVRSSRTLQKQLKAKEPWYILTNDFDSGREEILKIYYYRFEIEETFKDIKHLFNTKPNWIKKTKTLKTILWFQILGIWLCCKLKHLIPPEKNSKKLRSWIRRIFETIQAEIKSLAFCFQPLRKEVMHP